MLAAGEAFESIVGLESGAVLVEGDTLPDVLAPGPQSRLAMVPAVVVAVISDPEGRRPSGPMSWWPRAGPS